MKVEIGLGKIGKVENFKNILTSKRRRFKMKKVKEISVAEYDNICQQRQIVGNEYGEKDEGRYNCWDILEEIADISNITGNRLVNRLIKQQGFVTREQRIYINKILDLAVVLFNQVKKLDKSIPDIFKTDENGGERIVPDCLLEEVEVDKIFINTSKSCISPTELER